MEPSWVDWLKVEIERALPTNTSGSITAEAERGILFKIVEKSDPLPYVIKLQETVNASLVELEQELKVKIAEVDLKADQANQTITDLKQTISGLENTIAALTQRVEVLENPQPI